ncbi:MAG: sensor histidine kinase [Deltaproteobacteria bacterium]|nr:sensor histidine kinase [Deltaproteobacteria bacterium]
MELFTNAHKYAFPEGRKGTIAVSLSRIRDGVFKLVVRDNGVGIPGTVDIEHSPGFGLSLVKDLFMQIDGTFLQYLRDAGTEFRIEFLCENE